MRKETFIWILGILLIGAMQCNSKKETFYYRLLSGNNGVELDSGKLINLNEGFAFDWKDHEILFNNLHDGIFFTQDKKAYIRLDEDKKFVYISEEGLLIKFSLSRPIIRYTKTSTELGGVVATIPQIVFSPCDSVFSSEQRKLAKRRTEAILSVLKMYNAERYGKWRSEELASFIMRNESTASGIQVQLIASDLIENPPPNPRALQEVVKAYPFSCEQITKNKVKFE